MKEENITEVFNKWFSNKMDSVHTMLPGQIINYEGHTTRKAEVKIMVKIRNTHNQIIEISPIKNVPVIFQSTKNFNMVFPLEKGDGCMLIFAESSIGNFLLNATDNALEADDLNRFDLSDCICVPGLWGFANLPDVSTLNDTDFWLQFQNASINITDTTNDINIANALGNIEISGTTGTVTTNSVLEVLI